MTPRLSSKKDDQRKAMFANMNRQKGSGKKRFKRALERHNQRSPNSIRTDEKKGNRHTVSIHPDRMGFEDAIHYENWKQDYGSADIVGIDTIQPEGMRKQILTENEKKIPFRKTQAHRDQSRERMKDNAKLKAEFLSQVGEESLKNSKLKFLELASLQSRIKEGSHDWKSDSIYDDLDFQLSYDENLEIINEKYPKFDQKDINSQISEDQRKLNKEFIKDYYLEKSENNPQKAITDSNSAENVKKIPDKAINKKWLENPFSKSGGDYKGIDDGTHPLQKSDFSKDAFLEENFKDSRTKRIRKK